MCLSTNYEHDLSKTNKYLGINLDKPLFIFVLTKCIFLNGGSVHAVISVHTTSPNFKN